MNGKLLTYDGISIRLGLFIFPNCTQYLLVVTAYTVAEIWHLLFLPVYTKDKRFTNNNRWCVWIFVVYALWSNVTPLRSLRTSCRLRILFEILQFPVKDLSTPRAECCIANVLHSKRKDCKHFLKSKKHIDLTFTFVFMW